MCSTVLLFFLILSDFVHESFSFSKYNFSTPSYHYNPKDWINGYFFPYIYPEEISFNTYLNIVSNIQNLPSLPPIVSTPGPGVRAYVQAPEYAGTGVSHLVTLPDDWSEDAVAQGSTWPVIVEYTGNYAPDLGSSGTQDGAGLGYGISLGRFIVVVMPYINTDRSYSSVWWGDITATVTYAIVNIPRILDQYGGNHNQVLLTGFSRGAVAVSFIGIIMIIDNNNNNNNNIGLYNDTIAKLWTALVFIY
jgi:hypothetical protein